MHTNSTAWILEFAVLEWNSSDDCLYLFQAVGTRVSDWDGANSDRRLSISLSTLVGVNSQNLIVATGWSVSIATSNLIYRNLVNLSSREYFYLIMNISATLSARKVIEEVMIEVEDIEVHTYITIIITIYIFIPAFLSILYFRLELVDWQLPSCGVHTFEAVIDAVLTCKLTTKY